MRGEDVEERRGDVGLSVISYSYLYTHGGGQAMAWKTTHGRLKGEPTKVREGDHDNRYHVPP